MITAAQLWYIMTVYPECVTHHEVEKEFEEYCQRKDFPKEQFESPMRKEESEKFLWECRAKKVNELINAGQVKTCKSTMEKIVFPVQTI